MREKRKVFVTRPLPFDMNQRLFQTFFRVFDVFVNPANKALTEAELEEGILDCDAVLSTISDKFTADVLDDAARLKVISNYAVGLDNIDVEHAESLGITVYNVPDVVTDSTAELTIGLLLALVRGICPAQRFVREGKWGEWDPLLFQGEQLYGKTFGILGFGRIGRAVAKRAFAFGMRIIYFDPYIEEAGFKPAQRVTFGELLRQSDYISLHVPLTEETKHIINSFSIAKMERKPIIINMARGPVIYTPALVRALELGQIRGAALDVTDPEPLPGNHPLGRFPNCLIVPHIGTATKECRETMARAAAGNILRHFEAIKSVYRD